MTDRPELQAHNELSARTLRDTAEQEGYVFLRRLLPRDRVRALARSILQLCREAAWLEPGSPLEEARVRPGILHVEPDPGYMAVYDRVLALESFHELAHEPKLVSVCDSLFGEPTLVHARNIARIVFPDAPATPPHQDHVHIRGTVDTWTAWIVLLDCPRELGGLAISPGSHRSGLLPVRQAEGAGGLEVDEDPSVRTFRTTDFAPGDVLLFHSLTLHRALPNTRRDRLRLSVDFRYQPASQPFVAASFEPHWGRLGWERIYAGWESRRLQYYWREQEHAGLEAT